MADDTTGLQQLVRRIEEASPATEELSWLDDYLIELWIELWPDGGQG
jgi:hypothetical protein